MKRALLVFVKLPTPGRVKTRLARAIGPEQASNTYKFLVTKVLDQIKDAPFDSVRIQFDPPECESDIRSWLEPLLEPLKRPGIEIRFFPQAKGDLGFRLEDAFSRAFADGFDQVAAIGTDCIDLTLRHFEETWRALGRDSDVVFGPADDGGYYLVALADNRPEIFRDIPWSGSDTLEKSIAAARAGGLRISRLGTLHDIDEIDDWQRVRRSLER